MTAACRAHVLSLAAMATAAVAPSCLAQAYPSRPVTFVVSFAAGGVADVVARLVVQKLNDHGVGTFVVENRGGAGGNIAARFVVAAPADGYTVLATTTAIAVNATTSKNRGYQMEDLRAVAISAIAPDVMAVSPQSPYKSVKDLIEGARDQVLSYGSSGFGTGPYIGSTYFFQEIAKLKVAHVPFTGGGPAVAAAIGNHVPVVIVGLPTAAKQIEENMLRGLGVASAKRNAAVPAVPTFTELGYPDYLSATWAGFFLPARTPEGIAARLNAEITTAIRAEDAQQKLRAIGFDPMTQSLSEATDYARAEVALWGNMARAIGFTSD